MAGGTLDNLGLIKREHFKPAVQDTLNTNGDSAAVMGIGVPLELPPMPADSILSDNLDVASQFDELMAQVYEDSMDSIDTALPPNRLIMPIFDPTFFIPVQPLVEVLIELGIENPLEWVMLNLPGFLEIPMDAIIALAACDTVPFAEELNKIDESIDVDEATEKLEAVCDFEIVIPELPEIPPTFNLPGLDLPLPDLKLAADFQLFIEGFAFEFGNWLPGAMIEFPKIVLGIPPFIEWLINEIMELIIALLMAILKFIKTAVLLCAQMITYVGKLVAAIVVALVGFIIGEGLITGAIAVMVGLA